MSKTKAYAKSVFKSEGAKTSVVRFKEIKPMQLHIEVKEDGKVTINNHYHNGTEFTYSAENITFTTNAEELEKFAKEVMKAAAVLKKLIKTEKVEAVKTTTVVGKAGVKDIEITPELSVMLSSLQKLGVIEINQPQKKTTKKGKKGGK